MWYRFSDSKNNKPPANRSKPPTRQNKPPVNPPYPFIPPKGDVLPWHGNIVLDKSKYSPQFRSWVQSQLHPTTDGAGEGGVKNWDATRGGLTNKGITQSEYNDFRKSQDKTPQSVRYISGDEVNQILHRNYWARLNLEKMPDMIAMVIGTFGLLRGAEEAASALQEHLQKTNSSQPITGNIYKTTIENLKKATKTKQKEYEIAVKMIDELSSRLDPSLGGYKKRIDYLRKLIENMYKNSKSLQEVSSLKQEIETELQNLSISLLPENLNFDTSGQPIV